MSTILIVDDMPKSIQVVMSVLKHKGYKMLFATEGKKTVDMIDRHKIDLVILDIMMPDINGFEVCKQIKKLDDDIPVIFLSINDTSKYIEYAYEIGASDYIVKPYLNIELLTKVDTHLKVANKK